MGTGGREAWKVGKSSTESLFACLITQNQTLGSYFRNLAVVIVTRAQEPWSINAR